MKKKTLFIVYGIAMILLIPLVFDLFVNKQQFGSGFIILFLMAFATWGMLKLRKENEK